MPRHREEAAIVPLQVPGWRIALSRSLVVVASILAAISTTGCSIDFVALRVMTESDIPMLHDWLNRPHIVEWWGGERPTLAQVRNKYLPKIMADEFVTPYIATLGQRPIGYAQSYVALGSGGGWWEDETDPGVRGTDQSLAEATDLGKGLGTKLVTALVDLLFRDSAVTKSQTDPAPTNLRAIRCYEKAGFRQINAITTPDGPAIYMLHERPRVVER